MSKYVGQHEQTLGLGFLSHKRVIYAYLQASVRYGGESTVTGVCSLLASSPGSSTPCLPRFKILKGRTDMWLKQQLSNLILQQTVQNQSFDFLPC